MGKVKVSVALNKLNKTLAFLQKLFVTAEKNNEI